MMKRREAEKRTGAGKGATPIFSHKWVWWACGHGCQRMNTLQPCYTGSSSSISAATCFSKESEHTTPFHTMRVISKGSMVLVEQRYVPSPAPTTTTTTTIVVVTNYALQCHKYLLKDFKNTRVITDLKCAQNFFAIANNAIWFDVIHYTPRRLCASSVVHTHKDAVDGYLVPCGAWVNTYHICIDCGERWRARAHSSHV